jgi:nucleoside-diphosphate kinase
MAGPPTIQAAMASEMNVDGTANESSTVASTPASLHVSSSHSAQHVNVNAPPIHVPQQPQPHRCDPSTSANLPKTSNAAAAAAATGGGNDPTTAMAQEEELTCVIIKPDGVQRSLVGHTLSAFERKGYALVAMKMLTPCQQQVECHYREMAQYNFFPGLIKYMLSSPSVVMVWSGPDAIRMGRKLVGPPMPRNAKSGTLRGKYTESIGRNALHASAHAEEAWQEIKLWFPEGLVHWTSCRRRWVSECTGSSDKDGGGDSDGDQDTRITTGSCTTCSR